MREPMGQSLDELRRAFDEAFTRPSAEALAVGQAFLAIRVSTTAYALSVDGLRGLERGRKILPLPGSTPELLGLAGVRGQLVPVFSLGALLGHGTNPLESQWLALAGSASPVGFAFPVLESYLRAGPEDLHPVEEAQAGHPVRVCLRLEDGMRHVVDLGLLSEHVEKQSGPRAQ